MPDHCRHCNRRYTTPLRPWVDPPDQWRGSAQQYQDYHNERHDFCSCRSRPIPAPARPTQQEMFA